MAPILVVAGLLACAGDPDGTLRERVAMRDGVRLYTEVYLPEGDGPFPTVLIRTPYDMADERYAPFRYIPHGIAVVVQNTRGRFRSEGVDGAFTTDASDGYDAAEWIVAQPWSNGAIAMVGGSARGIAAYLLASTGHPGLVAISAEQATPSTYSDAVFQGGVRRYALTHNWLEDQGSLHVEQMFAEHPLEDAYWDSVQTLDQVGRVDVAGVHYVGWYDIFQQGGLDAYMAYQHDGGAGAVGAQRLIVGPWTHADDGELEYPENADEPPFEDLRSALIDHVFRPDMPLSELSFEAVPAVQYYVMGDVDDPEAPGNAWRVADDWPPVAAPARFHLSAGGVLSEACPGDGSPTTSYLFDPGDPSPTICGANMTIDAGPCDQRAVEARDDVVVFETDALTQPLEITGRMSAHLFVDIDQVDADLMVRLTDVYPDGRSMLVTDGALRLASRNGTTALDLVALGQVVEAVVDLWSTSIILNEGHRLRISVTSSNWPRFSVNRNNGLPYPESVEGTSHVVGVNLHHSAQWASYVQLPLPDREATDIVRCDLR